MPDTTKADVVAPTTLEELFQQACSWGAVYGEALGPAIWDQARDAKVAALMNSFRQLPLTLSEECLAVLEARELSVFVAPHGVAAVFDCDGERLFAVTADISAHNLRTALNLYENRYTRGLAHGRNEAFASLRALIGVDDAINQAKGVAA